MSELEEIENFRVVFTQDSSTITSNKSATEIQTAYNAGKYVYASLNGKSLELINIYSISSVLTIVFRDNFYEINYQIQGTSVTKITLADEGCQGIESALQDSYNNIVLSGNQITIKKEGFTIIYKNKPYNILGTSDYTFTPAPSSSVLRQFLCLDFDLLNENTNTNWDEVSGLLTVLDNYFTEGYTTRNPKNYCILASSYGNELQRVGVFTSELLNQKISQLNDSLDNIENTFKYKEIPFNYYNELNGNNNTFVKACYPKNIVAGHTYKLHIFNTDVDMSGVTVSGAYRFEVIAWDISGTNLRTLIYKYTSDTLDSDYTFTAPSNCFYLSIGGRCTLGHSLKFSIEDISLQDDLSEAIANVKENINDTVFRNIHTIEDARNGSINNTGNVVAVAMKNIFPIGNYSSVTFTTNRPVSANCEYRYGYSYYLVDTGLTGHDSPAFVYSVAYANNTNNKITSESLQVYSAKGFGFCIAEYNTSTQQFNTLRITDFANYNLILTFTREEEELLANGIVLGLNLKFKDKITYSDVAVDIPTRGSVQPSGGVSVDSGAILSDFIPIVPINTIKINTDENIVYNGVTYILRTRITVLQKAQAGNTVYQMLKERTSALTNTKIPSGDYHYLRFSLYITTDGSTLVSTELAEEIWANTTHSFELEFSPGIWEKNYPLNEIDDRITALEDEISVSTDIVKLNSPTQTLSYFKNLVRQYKGSLEVTRKNLVLAHFSDLHGTRDNLLRVLEYCEEYSDYIDDILCTGDIIPNAYNQITDAAYTTLWTDAEDVLVCLGNHDTAEYTTTYDWTHYIGLPAYNRYFAPYISNWGVTQPSGAATNGYCYYYKDYTSEKVRLIVLDVMGYDSTQETWFQATLASAITSDLSVVCAIHYPANMNSLNVSFDCRMNSTSFGDIIPAALITDVANFITNGGEFVCWLVGHVHRDFFGTIVSNNGQVCIAVDTSSSSTPQQQFDNIQRESGKKSQDLFNIFSVDTYNKRLCLLRVGADTDTMLRHIGTLCYDYQNKELIWNN